MARYFRRAFATAGDRTALPDDTQANGNVSYQQGYGPDYSRNPETDSNANRVERQMFNQVLFDVTSTLQLYYQTGVPPFIESTDNGGTAFSYVIGARVVLSNRIYENTVASNTATPPGTGWVLVDVSGNDARYYTRTAADARYYSRTLAESTFLQESSNLSDLDSASTARTNLGIGEFNSGQSMLAASGYYRLPGGFIVQWLSQATLSPGQTATRNWPIPFPNACLFAACQDVTRTDAVLPVSFNGTPNATSCMPSNSGGGSTKTYWVFAIGH